MAKKRHLGKKKSLEPQQERSRESLEKLLRAAIEVLGQHGVEGATIPRIAHHAGLTPGSVYRRFADKDALLETAILGMLERQDKGLRNMTPDLAREISLRAFAETTINNIVVAYRARAPMLRALRQFVRSRRGTAFFRKADKLELSTYQQLVDLFVTHADRIKHPDPRRAVATGLLMVINTVVELVVMHEDWSGSGWKELLPPDDQALRRELVRAFLSYLGVEAAPGAAGKMEQEQMAAMNRWRERSSQNV